ncbi:MAG: hypothetical protein EBR40_10000 [Proteobacteria bacterium]|nr:hypothetical protein [Pseudomonadota bacterium]
MKSKKFAKLSGVSISYAPIEIYGTGGNITEHPFYKKDPAWAYLTHAVIDGKMGCKITGAYLCWDTSIEDQNGLPTCPVCRKKVEKARKSVDTNLLSDGVGT